MMVSILEYIFFSTYECIDSLFFMCDVIVDLPLFFTTNFTLLFIGGIFIFVGELD